MHTSSIKAFSFLVFISLHILVSVTAHFEFTVRFYEYWNPTGLCAECGTNGVPVCCDDPQRTESCVNTEGLVFRCDTRFRFIQRPFNAPLETAPNMDNEFPFISGHTNENHDIFSTGADGWFRLVNPVTRKNKSPWTGRIQFLVDAYDRINNKQAPTETEGIIDRFVINLDQLQLGADLSEETNFTGINNISQLAMSFRVECSENYYGSNCTAFCEAEGVFRCDRDGNIICIEGRDLSTNCTECLPRRDINTNCTECSKNYYGSDCTTFCEAVEGVYNCDSEGDIVCVEKNRDPSTNCSQCLPGRNSTVNCTECSNNYYGSNCTTFCEPVEGVYTCDSDGKKIPICTDKIQDPRKNCTTDEGVVSTVAIAGAAGGVIVLLLIIIGLILIILFVILGMRYQQHKRTRISAASPINDVKQSVPNSETSRDLSNPLYESSTSQTQATNAIYEEAKPVVAQSRTIYTGTYEVVDLQNSQKHEGTQNGIFDDPNYNLTESITTTTAAGSRTQSTEYARVFDNPEYDTTANGGLTKEQPSAIFDNPEYEFTSSVSGITSKEYSKLNHSSAHQDPTSSLGTDCTKVTAYSKLNQDTSTKTNSLPPTSSQHPTPQPVYDVVTTNTPPPNLGLVNDAPLVYHYTDSPAQRALNNCSRNSNSIYTNTSPGEITPEALDHYDLGQ